jgi:hypothetical protein
MLRKGDDECEKWNNPIPQWEEELDVPISTDKSAMLFNARN